MTTSVLDLFESIGPSPSHTVGPMKATRAFAEAVAAAGLLDRTQRVRVRLHGSLAATGRGHGTDRAVVLGLMGETPEGVDVDAVPRLRRRRPLPPHRRRDRLSLQGDRPRWARHARRRAARPDRREPAGVLRAQHRVRGTTTPDATCGSNGRIGEQR